MTGNEIFEQKNHARDEIKAKYDLPRRNKALVCIVLGNMSSQENIVSALEILPANFLILSDQQFSGKNYISISKLDDINMVGLDAILTSCNEISIETYMKSGVVPLINENNYLGKILSEFSAVKGEGNAYLYEDNNFWSANYALIRYLENMKFPYDNRNLVKNVVGL